MIFLYLYRIVATLRYVLWSQNRARASDLCLSILHPPSSIFRERMKERNVLYVSGLAAEVTEEVLFAAFVPFGELRSVQIGRDYVRNVSKVAPNALRRHHFLSACLPLCLSVCLRAHAQGFAFVEFEQDEDAAAAIENMEGSEIFGKVLSVSIARNVKTDGGAGGRGKAVWHTEEFLEREMREKEALLEEDLPPEALEPDM